MKPTIRLLLLALLGPASLLAAEEQRTLVISALDWQDQPLAGVTFEVLSGGREPVLVQTDEAGQGVLQPGSYAVPSTIRLSDPGWTSPLASVDAAGTAPMAFFTLYRANPRDMSPGERWAYARQANPMASLPKDADIRPALALIERYREIAEAPAMSEPPGQEATPAVAVRVLGALGYAAEGVTVYLYVATPGEDTAQIAGFERTDDRGEVLFASLPPDRPFRVQASSGSLVARSAYAMSPTEGATVLDPLVLREEGAFVDGLVADAGKPVQDALVRVVEGTRVLATSTDEWGYFQLGPLRGQGVSLQVNAPGGGRSAEVTVDAGSGELYLPLEILAPAATE